MFSRAFRFIRTMSILFYPLRQADKQYMIEIHFTGSCELFDKKYIENQFFFFKYA